jgi:hypothetical protein
VPQKSFSGPTDGHFQELEQGTVEFVHLKRKTGVLVTHESKYDEKMNNTLIE